MGPAGELKFLSRKMAPGAGGEGEIKLAWEGEPPCQGCLPQPEEAA